MTDLQDKINSISVKHGVWYVSPVISYGLFHKPTNIFGTTQVILCIKNGQVHIYD
jgi:hypothetical protein